MRSTQSVTKRPDSKTGRTPSPKLAVHTTYRGQSMRFGLFTGALRTNGRQYRDLYDELADYVVSAERLGFESVLLGTNMTGILVSAIVSSISSVHCQRGADQPRRECGP